jgi:ribosomal protein S12 methylthiotransferase accessory factor
VAIPQRELLAQLVSPRVGLITRLQRVDQGGQAPVPPFIYQATVAAFDYRRASPITRLAVGKGRSESEAIAGAVGEAVERYCASHTDPRRIWSGPALDAAVPLIDPSKLVLYSPAQYLRDGFPYRPYDDAAPMSWARATALPSQEEVLVPASLVYLYFHSPFASDEIAEVTSNGLAAGPDLPSAVLAGLLELIERDGFLISWLARLPLPRVDLGRLGGITQDVIRFYRSRGVELEVFDATTEVGVPVMMAVAVDRSGSGPAAVVGLGAGLDPADAVRRAVLEVCQIHPGEAVRYRLTPPRTRFAPFGRIEELFGQVQGMLDHSALFTLPASLGELSFLLDGSERRRLEELPDLSSGRVQEDLETCVQRLAAAGCQAAYVDLTTPDVAPLGFRVVRAIATELQPIHFGFGCERRGGRRLYEVPRLLGYATAGLSESDLNPCPHPLA